VVGAKRETNSQIVNAQGGTDDQQPTQGLPLRR
jgi:hypothetical protein